ncbi:MAG: hypothetical protein WC579_00360 [Candidatus Paceibacterota bacterium]|jgi:hypothetical protein|nr:hypothetical protein [Candidatus Paceibacterota bacterium]HQM34934.1 hypothetical protein [Candidatus Paceibacterota bacterium]
MKLVKSEEPVKKIVFCSSQRFRSELLEFINEFREIVRKNQKPFMILEPDFDTTPKEILNLSEKERLQNSAEYRERLIWDAANHLFRRVKIADIVFIFNKNGYIGVNTSGELFAAAVLDKKIYSLEKKILMGHYPDDLYEEPFVSFLVWDVAQTPQEFFNKICKDFEKKKKIR